MDITYAKIYKAVNGSVKSYLDAHPEITRFNTSSLSKRISGQIYTVLAEHGIKLEKGKL